jgi:ketosteroid isomerase-like protein
MMKTWFPARLVLAFLVLLVAVGGCKPNTDKIRAAIQAQINKNLAAQSAHDSTTFWSIYTDDYTYRSYDGQVYSRDDAARGFTESVSQMKISPETKTTVDSIQVEADTATVVASLHFVRTQMAADSSQHNVVTDGRFREVWMKTEDGWKVNSIEELAGMTTLVDGTPIPVDRPGMELARAFWAGGLDSLRVLYMAARAVKQDSIPFQEDTLTRLGKSLVAQMRVVDAMHVYEMITECYPTSASAWDNLGEAYLAAGQRDLAARAYTHALQMDKTDATAKEMVAKLATP